MHFSFVLFFSVNVASIVCVVILMEVSETNREVQSLENGKTIQKNNNNKTAGYVFAA